MEVAEKAPIASKPSLVKRVISRFFTGEQTVSQPPSIPRPKAEVIVQRSTPPEARFQVAVGKEARETRKAVYAQAKTSSAIEDPIEKDEAPIAQSEIESPQDSASRGLPSSFKEVKRAQQPLTLLQKDLPWLDQQSLQVPLVEITLSGSDEQKFFYGSAILGKELIGAANQLDERRSRIANNLLYSHLPDFIRNGSHPYIKLTHGVITERPIYNVHNKGGQRVFLMRFDKLQDIPVIIRIAVCDKDREAQVLGVITTRSHKKIKQLSKL